MKKVKKTGIYFTEDTENAIIKYNESTDDLDRNAIYLDKIHGPLNKLVENVINRFKFPYINLSFKDLKNQVLSFLIINLHKYKKENGKAFSYFSVIAKNYLILQNNSSYSKQKTESSLDDEAISEDDLFSENTIISNSDSLLILTSDEKTEDNKEFIRLSIEFWDENIPKIFKKKRDIEIAGAIVHLLRKIEHIENFNKKAIYLMIKELTNHKTNHITKIINKMKKIMIGQWKRFQSYGIL